MGAFTSVSFSAKLLGLKTNRNKKEKQNAGFFFFSESYTPMEHRKELDTSCGTIPIFQNGIKLNCSSWIESTFYLRKALKHWALPMQGQ